MRQRLELGGRLSQGARATLLCCAVVGAALALLGWSLLQAWTVLLGVAAALTVACAVVLSRARLQTVGVVLIGLFCFTASWDQTSLAGVGIRQLFLLSGGFLLALGLDPRRLPPVPWWLHAYGLTAIVASSLQAVFPVDESYLDERYAASASGQALGERAGELSSLLSLLFNNYAVPVVIVAACMYLPGVLRWLIGAYVLGAAMSCAAAILAYYGQPALADAFGGLVSPPGVRASGFTSHPLRLATSGLMALALASWMALQSHPVLKWGGRLSVPTLVIGLYVSGSRGGIVAGLLLLIFATFMLPDVRRRLHVVLGVVTTTLLGLYFLFPSAVYGVLGRTRILGDRTATVSNIGRNELFAQGLQDFQVSPVFGIGVRFIAEAHTLYLGVLAAGGVIFGVGFLLFNVGSVLTSVRAIQVDRSLGGALLATLIASLCYWLVADLIQTKTVALIYGFLIALWWQGQPDADQARSASSRRLPGSHETKTRARSETPTPSV